MPRPSYLLARLPGWRQDKQRAWLWTVVTAGLTVFGIDRSHGGAGVEALLGSQFVEVVIRTAGRRITGLRQSSGRWGLAEIGRLFVLWHR